MTRSYFQIDSTYTQNLPGDLSYLEETGDRDGEFAGRNGYGRRRRSLDMCGAGATLSAVARFTLDRR